MEILDILSDSDEKSLISTWDPDEWISAGKIYHDVPPVVDAARRNLLQIPPSFTKNLPSKSMSISQLLQFDLPPKSDGVDGMDIDSDGFTITEPTRELEEVLPFLALPTRSALSRLLSMLGQAWFDGGKSIQIALNPEVVFPFWVLTYWSEILDACDSKDAWLRADSWVDRTGKTADEITMKLTIRGLLKVVRWHGHLQGFGNVKIVGLAALFSEDHLGSEIVDALLALLSFRLRQTDGSISENNLIVDTTFAAVLGTLLPIVDGVATGPITTSGSGQRYLEKYGAWSQQKDHRNLHMVLYRPPTHWTACSLDFDAHHIRYGDSLRWERPQDFFDALEFWVKEHDATEFIVTDDLPCAKQTDGYSCPIIAVNTIAHSIFGDALWTPGNAKAMRMKAFRDIVKYSLSAQKVPECNVKPVTTDSVDNLLAANPDFNDDFLPYINDKDVAVVAEGPRAQSEVVAAASSCGTKRPADVADEVDVRETKIAKTTESSDAPGRQIHSFFAPKSLPSNANKLPVKSTSVAAQKRKPKPSKTASTTANTRAEGTSKSATAARNLLRKIDAGEFTPSAVKTRNFRHTIRESFDSDAVFEPNSIQVQCSNCKAWVKMKCPYDTYRFKEHNAKPCSPPPPPPPPSKTRTLDKFQLAPIVEKPKAKKALPAPKVQRPCPGLTAADDERVGQYLDRSGCNGGGARAIAHYSEELFKKPFTELSEAEKQLAYAAQQHGHAWRNDLTPGIKASFATGSTACLKTVEIDPASGSSVPPCTSCQMLLTLKSYIATINKPAADPKNLRYVPKRNQNPHAGQLYMKFHGLQELVSEDNQYSLERRYFQHVINGDFKNDTIFNGIIQAKILGKDREVKGLGKQNFKHNEDVDAVFGLIHAISPRAYREIAKHIPLRSERSIKQKTSSAPRFAIGIQQETFQYAERYCEDYKYPRGAPLSLSVDDTKLHAALRPLYNGPLKKWFIVGATGEPTEVPNAESLNETLDELEKTAEVATKLRLWVLQIPLPGVPPLVLAVMPIGSAIKGTQLAEWQLNLMNGLISRGFRITSSGGDGAAVERDCQRRTAAASKVIEYRIKHPDPDYPDIIVTVWELNGNVWVEIQDAKHGLKTFRNNASSGARGLVLGNVVVYFEQIHDLAMKPDSPMYPRDVNQKRDRMDDPAASRLFSADTLAQASQDPEKNLGLVVYLLVFGDFIDAYQSRTLSHHERAKIAIRTHLFLQTWRAFLKKAGYSESRHFISKEAFAISEILVNGLLGLIFIHRDHLGAHSTPLLPWFNASEPNEHTFAGLRDVSKDFTFQEALLIVPKLRAKMQASVRSPPDPAAYKRQASGYCHTYFTSEDIDFALLGQYPTDVEMSTAYKIAAEENDCLWTLLGIHPAQIKDAPMPNVAPQPAPDPTLEHLFLSEEELNDNHGDLAEPTAAEEVQRLIDNLQSTVGLSRAEDEQLDACVMASVALSMDELARIEDLPESNPERFAEIQRDIANAMATQPAAFISLLQGMAECSTRTSTMTPTENPSSSRPLVDVSADDLAPLVQLRREHQTRDKKMGVRTYKASGTYTNHKTGVTKQLSDRQILAQRMNGLIKRDNEQGSSTGLNRSIRWKTNPTALPVQAKTGNAANTEVTAVGRANETVKRRRAIFGKLKCLSTVAEAGIGSHQVVEAGSYGFAMVGSGIVLARAYAVACLRRMLIGMRHMLQFMLQNMLQAYRKYAADGPQHIARDL
ncbi:hypothetical protein C8R43DRAFT_1236758 [Mycena crocata]|nr:hypothetical protein C8R43DRAFT_1236758 [Mycena crocata]